MYHSVETLLVAAISSWRVIIKAQKQCDKASPFFKTILHTKGIGPMFASAEFTVGFF